MKIPSPRANRKARIEIIPLIDIIFFLLATFVMVSLSMVKNKGLPINLPVASSASTQDRNEFSTITVTENGEYFFDKMKIDKNDLTSKLRKLHSTTPNAKLFINGDAKAAFQNVVFVLDEARKIGISKVAVETASPPGH